MGNLQAIRIATGHGEVAVVAITNLTFIWSPPLKLCKLSCERYCQFGSDIQRVDQHLVQQQHTWAQVCVDDSSSDATVDRQPVSD